MQKIEIYVIEGCPYCAKVISKLDSLDVKYRTIKVPRAKSERDEVVEISGQSSVPVITDRNNDVKGMNESSDIVEYLEEEYGEDDNEQSDEWKMKSRISDVIYHVIDGVIEFF